ncbi:TPA: hypothetical protein QDB15_004290 [Burkholderia vietnamiensis]|uniref:hypothetical protein n=1 Tax=Burkholderia cepacia complex TaxID=87882 RepID=UPI001178C22F|nr:MULTISPECIES: hypothetical protein [Burkholderia cepacia complex]MBR8009289.1 hypothetical protein [Burkholderia vietnamiensis]MBR8150849.1 hypothetical protein [Burkholderia vietnamiensis]MBR8164821.1 hypothetical protein [Burkholderia vietnamiensis]MBR8193059.1 hypothetical protein [Burkholderia vietnamiensis]MCA8210440.1 hypothetical protein [Burkholderia vietnamiensis]
MSTNRSPASDLNVGITVTTVRPTSGDDLERFVSEHSRLRERGASAIELGLFYQRGLTQGVWPNQATLARSIGISKSYVSTAIRAARLPDEIVTAVGGTERVSFRTAAMLEEVIRAVGANVACLRASIIGNGRGLDIGDVVSSIATGRPPLVAGRKLSIKVSRTGKFIKIESPNLEKLIANLPAIEALLGMYL